MTTEQRKGRILSSERGQMLKWLSVAMAISLIMAAQVPVLGLPQQPSTKSDKPPAKQAGGKSEGKLSAPRLIFSPDPQYTAEARRAHVEGSIVLTLMVGTDGRPHDIKVIRPLGHGLDEETIKTVRTWRFEPARRNGKPVPI